MLYAIIGIIGFLFGRYGVVVFDSILELFGTFINNRITKITVNTEIMKVNFDREYNNQNYQEEQNLIGFKHPDIEDEYIDDSYYEDEDCNQDTCRCKNKKIGF